LRGIESQFNMVGHSDIYELHRYPVDLAQHVRPLKRQPNFRYLEDCQDIHVVGVAVVQVINPVVKPFEWSSTRRSLSSSEKIIDDAINVCHAHT
jgi:hypothetical protein